MNETIFGGFKEGISVATDLGGGMFRTGILILLGCALILLLIKYIKDEVKNN